MLTPASRPGMRGETTKVTSPPRKNVTTRQILWKYEIRWKNHGAASFTTKTGMAIDIITTVVAIVDPAKMSSAAIKQISS